MRLVTGFKIWNLFAVCHIVVIMIQDLIKLINVYLFYVGPTC